MPPKDKKKKPAKKAPAYQTGEADLQPFGVQVGQLVRSSLGCTATVLGVRAGAAGVPQLWVRYEAGGLEAPLEAGLQLCGAAQQLRRDMERRRQEAEEREAKWRAYEAEQARKAAEAQKAAAKRKKKAPAGEAAPPAGDAAPGAGLQPGSRM